MENLKKNTNEDVVKALEKSMKLIEKMSEGDAANGACLYVPPNGQQICVQTSSERCAEIGGVFMGGPCP